MKTDMRVFVCVFFMFLGLFCLVTGEHFLEPYYSFDERFHFATAISIATQGSLHFEAIDGQTASKFGILPALLAIPFYAVGSLVSDLFPLEQMVKNGLVTQFFYLVNAFITALLLAFFYRFSRFLSYPRRSALYATIILGIGTMLLPYTKYFYIESIVALLALLLCLSLCRWNRDGKTGRLVAAGFWFALLLLTRLDNLALLPVMGLAISWKILKEGSAEEKRPGRLVSRSALRAFAAFLLPVSAGIGAHLIIEYMKYRGQPSGYAGEVFSTNFFFGLFGNLFSAGRSIFLYSPPMLAALMFFPRFARRHAFAAFVVAGTVLLKLFVFGKWWGWNGGMCIGPRFLLPVIPLCCLALNEGFCRWKRLPGWVRGLTWATVLSGLYVQIIAALFRPGLQSEYYHVMAGGDENQLVYIPNISGLFPAPGIIRMGHIDNWMMSWSKFLPAWTAVLLAAGEIFLIAFMALCLYLLIRPRRQDLVILSPRAPAPLHKAFAILLLANVLFFLLCYLGKNMNILWHEEIRRYKDGSVETIIVASRQIAVDRRLLTIPENLDEIQMRWKGELDLPLKGIYIFYMKANGGALFKLDDQPLILSQKNEPQSTRKAELRLKPGRHFFTLDYTPGDLARPVLHLYATFPGFGVDRELLTNRNVFMSPPSPLVRASLFLDNFKCLAPLLSLLLLALIHAVNSSKQTGSEDMEDRTMNPRQNEKS